MFFLPVVCLILFLFFPSLVFLSVTRPYLVLMFPFVLCFLFTSRLHVFALCYFFLVPPLSHLLCFLLPRPPRALEKDNREKNNYLILFAFRGSLQKCPLRKISVYLIH